jgi:hypothetical protein
LRNVFDWDIRYDEEIGGDAGNDPETIPGNGGCPVRPVRTDKITNPLTNRSVAIII